MAVPNGQREDSMVLPLSSVRFSTSYCEGTYIAHLHYYYSVAHKADKESVVAVECLVRIVVDERGRPIVIRIKPFVVVICYCVNNVSR